MHWRVEKEAALRAENGWLALAGLFWLKEGNNSLGSDISSDITLPARAPGSLGNFILDGRKVKLQVKSEPPVMVDHQIVDTETLLRADTDDSPSYITFDTLRMVVIERPNGIGIRLWDNLRPERRIFPPREWFPINEKFRLPARYLHFPEPKKVLMPDTFGEIREDTMDGQLTFELDGKMVDLDASEQEGGRLYIQFRDLTSGKETYPTGRYYYTLDAVTDGKITLDFNFAYSPPCAFTEYATCLFAPEQNFINTRIEAGEYYHAQH